ncbi:hypothetical protein FRC07_003317 [Ceratobasidium sp. 392]|nr:hypothetical protein FRC07_003317 [Ceratobasidium sp. 392]
MSKTKVGRPNDTVTNTSARITPPVTLEEHPDQTERLEHSGNIVPFEIEEPRESGPQYDVDKVGFWLLAAQHFSRHFFLLCRKITGVLIELSSIYGFVTTAAGILLSGWVNSDYDFSFLLIDTRARLPAIRTCIFTQKMFASICYALFLILFSRLTILSADMKRLMLGIITMCGCGLKLATVGMNVCVERDWVMAIAAESNRPRAERSPATHTPDQNPSPNSESDNADRVLLRLNTALRRIDLICKLVAPLFVSLLTSTVGYRLSAVVLLGVGVIAAVFETVFAGVVYAKFPVLALPRFRERIVFGAREWTLQQVGDWSEFGCEVYVLLLPFTSYEAHRDEGLFGTFLMPWVEKRIG